MNFTNIRRRGRQFISYYQDREFFSHLFRLALPIILQQFIMSSLNMVGVMMIGQLGETAVAAVGLSNQIFFLLNLTLFGANSGAAIFIAQLWGVRDIANIRKVLGLALTLGLATSAVFAVVSVVIPHVVLGIYSEDPAVVEVGSQYLRIFGLSFLFTAITFSYAFALRSTGDVKTPMMVSISALSLNALLSYGLIFGKLGLPTLGVRGAAIAILTARTLECGTLLFLTFRRRSLIAAGLREMFTFDRVFAGRVLQRVVPVTLNEVLWSLGITAYYIVYARIGTEAIAAMNIASTIDGLALVFFIGIGNACAILVGNVIGANEEKKAQRYAGTSLSLGMIGGVLIGGLVLLLSGYILTFYNVSPLVIQTTRKLLTVIACFLWVRVSNLILFVGILRSGGDTRFAFLVDAGTIWVIGVPLALLGAFVFHLPIYQVYLLIMVDELTKLVVGSARFISRRWINNLTTWERTTAE